MSEVKRAGLEICQRLVACFLASNAIVMILCAALSQMTRVRCVSVTGNLKKTSHLNIIIPLLPEKKNSRLKPSAGKMRVHLFSGLPRHVHKEYMVKV